MNLISNYEQYDALALTQLIKQKEITAQELLETAIAKTEQIDLKINSVVNKMYDLARQQIRHINLQAPLAGLPLLLKDLGTMYKGVPTTQGSRFFQSFIPNIDSEIVKRFKKAGCVIFGKTNVPEFGMSYTTEPILFGPCRNPWDLNRTPGGSSGGAAAAVAAGIIPMAHASDGGGSIRIPAACCGLFGLKPTRARVPCGPVIGEGWAGLSTYHVISKSVRDSAAMLDLISGPELGDPYYAPPQTENFLKLMKENPGTLRIAFSTQAPGGITVDPECIRAVEHALKLCASLGHEVIEKNVNCNHELLSDAMNIIVSANLAMLIQMQADTLGYYPTEKDIEPIHLLIEQESKHYTGADYAKAIFIIQNQTRQIAKFFIDYDIFISPTTATLPVNIGALNPKKNKISVFYQQLMQFAPFTSIWNQAGQPAMSVPLYWTENNIPVGVQFVARFGDEKTLFQLAHQLETLAPWWSKYKQIEI